MTMPIHPPCVKCTRPTANAAGVCSICLGVPRRQLTVATAAARVLVRGGDCRGQSEPVVVLRGRGLKTEHRIFW